MDILPIFGKYLIKEYLLFNLNNNKRNFVRSAGCVFYELIALRLPFDSDNFINLVKEIIENQPVKLDHKLFPLIEK